ncbi:hypothetical protein FACS1894196_2460 [Clostridia bacterium]|nr:hypothetical protein FACS1894196_2460 [Clostridia bacterium]
MLTQEYNEIGKVVTALGDGGKSGRGDKTTYQYNAAEQLVRATSADGEIVYGYDELGRKVEVTYPNGGVVRYAYDAMDRIVKVTDAAGAVTEYVYDALGRRVATVGEGLRSEYGYDVDGNLIKQTTEGNLTKQEMSGATALELSYAYDVLGRMVVERRTDNGGTGNGTGDGGALMGNGETLTSNGETLTSKYSYDVLGQLTRFTRSDGYAERYSYDAVGNMTGKTAGMGKRAVSVSMVYGKTNQLTSMRADGKKIVYGYDENGSLTSKTLGKLVDQYSYDAIGNLIGYKGYDGYEQVMAYSSLGVRTEKSEKGNANRLTLEEVLAGKRLVGGEGVGTESDNAEWVKTVYIQDITLGYGEVLEEVHNDGSRTAYTYGLERISAVTTGIGTLPNAANNTANRTLKTAYVYDGRGSVAQTISDIGTTSLRYTPFGEQIGNGSTKVSGYTYNGEAYDAATGMLNLRARQYEPAMNRFNQKDLLKGNVWEPLSLNRYAYVLNNPITYADPSGLKEVEATNYVEFVKEEKAKKTPKTPVPTVKIVAPAVVTKPSQVVKFGYSDAGGGYENNVLPSQAAVYTKQFDQAKSGLSEAAIKGLVVVYTNEGMLKSAEVAAKTGNEAAMRRAVGNFLTNQGELTPAQRQALSYAMRKYEADDPRELNAEQLFNICTQVLRAEATSPNDEALITEIAKRMKNVGEWPTTGWVADMRKLVEGEKGKDAMYSELILDWLNDLSKEVGTEKVNNTNVAGKWEAQIKAITKLFVLTAQEPVFGKTIVNLLAFDAFYGSKGKNNEELTSEDLVAVAEMLLEMNKENHIRYGTDTSAKYINGTLYLDCWGFIDTVMKLTLTKDAYEQYRLHGGVNDIYKRFSKKGNAIDIDIEIDKSGKASIPKDIKSGCIIFSNNNGDSDNFEHVLLYIEEKHFDANNEPYIVPVVIDIGNDYRAGDTKSGLKRQTLEEYYDTCLKQRPPITLAWGDPFGN